MFWTSLMKILPLRPSQFRTKQNVHFKCLLPRGAFFDEVRPRLTKYAYAILFEALLGSKFKYKLCLQLKCNLTKLTTKSVWVPLCTCTGACVVGKPVQLISLCAWIPRVCCSAILHSSIFSGLPPPTLPFPTVYTISVWQVPLLPSPVAGLPGFPSHGSKVSSRSWLPIVEAPRCLEHSTSI